MDNPAFLAFLQQEHETSLDGQLLEDVEVAIRSYNGELYGDEEEGRSQIVTRDVAETIDWMVPSIMRTIMSSDRVCELEADNPQARQAAEQATEKLHDDMRRHQYELLHDWCKAGCLEKIGVVKTCVHKRKVRKEYVVPEPMLPDDAIAAEESGEYDEYGNALWNIAVHEDAPVKIVDYIVPLEEFRFSPDARDFETARYLAHVTEKFESDLVEMGFDRELVSSLQSDRNIWQGAFRDNGRDIMGDNRTGANRKLWLIEEYCFYDLDDDGIAERLKVQRVGNTILEVEPVDYQPFEYWVPFRMPGRLIGHSLADKVVDIQRVTTVLTRNAFDSLYSQVAPGTFVDESGIGDHTIDDLLTVRPNRIVRYKGVPPVPEQKNDTSQIAFAAIAQVREERSARTGISKISQGLDADTLNQSATGAALVHQAGQLIEESLAREFAGAIARLFSRKYQLMRQFGEPFMLMVDGEYVEVDPRQWPEVVDLKVRVGLGSGRKDERIMYRREIGQVQALLMESGSPLVQPENVYQLLTAQARDMGFNPAELFTDPSQAPQQEEKPDPEMMKAQAELQLQQAKLQGEQQLGAMKLEQEREKNALAIELAREKAAAEQELAQAKAEFEARQAEAKFMFETQLAMKKMEFEEEQAERDARRADKESEAKVSANRPGGKLDE